MSRAARRLAAGLAVGLLAALALAQTARPLVANGRSLTSYLLPASTVIYAYADDLGAALGFSLTAGRDYAAITQGGRVLEWRVAGTAAGARFLGGSTVNGLARPGPGAVRLAGRLALPVQAVSQALGAVVSDDGRRMRVYLEAARLQPPVRSDRSGRADRAVLEFSRDANFSHRRDGSEAVVRVEGASGTSATYRVGGAFISEVRVRSVNGTLEVRVPLPQGAGYRAYALTAPARVVVDVGKGYAVAPPALETRPPTVVIDPGHGGADGGARGGGFVEKNLVLAVARELGAALKARGVNVRYSREGDTSPSSRARREASLSADALVSLHVSNLPGSSASGLTVYTLGSSPRPPRLVAAGRELLASKDDDPRKASLARVVAPAIESVKLADLVSGRVMALPGLKARVLTGAVVPSLTDAPRAAILVELGWLSSTADRLRLVSPSARRSLVNAMAAAIAEYLAPLKPKATGGPR